MSYLSLNFAISGSWSEPQSAPGPVFANCMELLHLQPQRCVCIHIYMYIYTHHIFLHSSVDGHFSFFCTTFSFNLHSLIFCILKTYLQSFLELRPDVNKEGQCLIHLCIPQVLDLWGSGHFHKCLCSIFSAARVKLRLWCWGPAPGVASHRFILLSLGEVPSFTSTNSQHLLWPVSPS